MHRRHLVAIALAVLVTMSTVISLLSISAPWADASTTKRTATQAVLVSQSKELPDLAVAVYTQTVRMVIESEAAQNTVTGSMWVCIREAESNDRYQLVSGAYGILISTWQTYRSVWAPFGNWAVPGQAPKFVQDLVAYHLYLVGGGYGGWHDRCTGRA